MDDKMVNRERSCKVDITIHSYGSMEHLQKTVERFFKEMTLQGFSFDVGRLDIESSVVEESDNNVVEIGNDKEVVESSKVSDNINFGMLVPVRVTSYSTNDSEKTYRYEASVPEAGMCAVLYTKTLIPYENLKAYLRREHGDEVLTIHDTKQNANDDDPRGFVLTRTYKEVFNPSDDISKYGKKIPIWVGTVNGIFVYHAFITHLNMILNHESTRKLIDPAVYLRTEGSLHILSLHEKNPLYSGDDPRGEIVAQTIKEF